MKRDFDQAPSRELQMTIRRRAISTSLRGIQRHPASLALIILACLLGSGYANAAAPDSQHFKRVPRDESLQPLAPATPGKIDFVGNKSFTADQLREPLAEQIRDIDKNGLTRPRADDTAYYLAVFYRKHGYANVDVH